MINKTLFLSTKLFFIILFLFFQTIASYSEEEEAIFQQLQILQKDIKTLEKAVYQTSQSGSSSLSVAGDSNDVLTKHLLKLSELEEQFKNLTNSFEEINFKIDKLSNRITKVQADNQVRFQDLESGNISQNSKNKKKRLPGSSEPQDLGGVSESEVALLDAVQKTQSIDSVGTVVIEETERKEKILPDVSPEKQYEFATSFLKVGDYETAEFALREFIDIHPKHELAGNAQYWYGETFRVRQLYQDAATAYLDGYQKYPKSDKAPINLLKLGIMMVQIGEKDQGCSMILNVKKQYPNANQNIVQKAEFEKKKFNCEKS